MDNFFYVDSISEQMRLAILAVLELDPKQWTEFTGRQDFPGSPQMDTECIILRGPLDLYRPDYWLNDTQSITYEDNTSPLYLLVFSVVNELLMKQGIELGRVMITKLKPSGRILPHRDEGGYAMRHRRFHIVLQSDIGNRFRCGDEVAETGVANTGDPVLKPGAIFTFTHLKEHEVWNNSYRDRIHLIVDMV